MSGETEGSVSAWTVDSLKEHLETLLREQDRRLQVHLAEQEKAMLAAHETIRAAVSKAEAATDRRFDGVNEFRAQLGDQTATLMPRAEADARLGSVMAAVETLRATLERSSFVTRELFDSAAKEQADIHDRLFAQLSAVFTDLSNLKGRSAAYTVAIGIAFSIITIVLRFIG